MKIIIHVGLHKTGTTFLQNGIFKNIKNVNYIRLLSIRSKVLDDKINIVGDESLSGKPFSVVYNYDMRPFITQRIKGMFPNAKIIVGVRQLEPWLKSCYKQSIIGGNWRSYNVWKSQINHAYWDMDGYVNLLKNTFDEVFVYTFEDLKSKPDIIVESMCSFMNVEVPDYKNKLHNISLSERQMKILRFFNKFLYSSHYNPKKKIPQYPISRLVRIIHNNR